MSVTLSFRYRQGRKHSRSSPRLGQSRRRRRRRRRQGHSPRPSCRRQRRLGQSQRRRCLVGTSCVVVGCCGGGPRLRVTSGEGGGAGGGVAGRLNSYRQ